MSAPDPIGSGDRRPLVGAALRADEPMTDELCVYLLSLDADGRALLARVADRFGFTARGYHRVLRVARTIADLDASAEVRLPHVAEAVSFRLTLAAGSPE